MAEPHHNHTIYGMILRHAITVLIVTFTLGGWVAKIQIDLTSERRRGDKLEAQLDELRDLKIHNENHARSLSELWGRVKNLEKKP